MALDPNLKDILQNLQSDITLTIQLKYLLHYLRLKRLVTEAESQQLSNDGKETEAEKNGKLIRIIMGKGEEAFDLFVEALQEETEHLGHNNLARKLQEEKNLQAGRAGELLFKRNMELKHRLPKPPPRRKTTSGAPIPSPKPNSRPQQVSLN